MERNNGEVDHYLTQLLSGHGCFLAYQRRFGIVDSASCPTCQFLDEDVEHVFFVCPRFHEDRNELKKFLRQRVTPENIVGLMTISQANWTAVADYAATIIRKLRMAEKIRLDQLRNDM